MSRDDDRIGYLAGEEAGELDAIERDELDELRALLADPAAWAEPDPALEDRVVAAVAEAAGQSRSQPVVESEGTTPADTVVPLRRRRLFTPLRIAVAGAAAAVIVAALVFALAGGNASTTEVALTGTELRPGAEGSVRITPDSSGLRIELDATGLPRRDGGRYYQAWLKNDAGDLVPIGTFHDPNDVVLWAGVPLRDYPTLTVTEEETNSDPASSGQRVLQGTAATDG
jgi:Anti-sigma-K factor rskA